MPRSYDYSLPKKVKLGALREALAAKLADGTLIVVDTLDAGVSRAKKTKTTAAHVQDARRHRARRWSSTSRTTTGSR